MRSLRFRIVMRGWLGVEAVASGLAYGGAMCWISVCMVASFRPGGLAAPYWTELPRLRCDTCGIAAFVVTALCSGTSEYLRLRRRQDRAPGGSGSPRGAMKLLVLATSETIAILATSLVIYVSVNTITHPATLDVRATHLMTWPTEGTLRVVALLLCVCSVATVRYLFAEPPPGHGTHRAVGHQPRPSSAMLEGASLGKPHQGSEVTRIDR
jgi:hypothetical protein